MEDEFSNSAICSLQGGLMWAIPPDPGGASPAPPADYRKIDPVVDRSSPQYKYDCDLYCKPRLRVLKIPPISYLLMVFIF